MRLWKWAVSSQHVLHPQSTTALALSTAKPPMVGVRSMPPRISTHTSYLALSIPLHHIILITTLSGADRAFLSTRHALRALPLLMSPLPRSELVNVTPLSLVVRTF